ncbi:MAG: hypothetical protein MAG453_00651 [Calditrichaeota bacterium]|nr:hypothetical protein [Calditrichota bacterium]
MKKDDRRRSDSLSSIIGADATIDGELSLEGSLRIDGSFSGTLTCGGSVTIGEHGSFSGDIDAQDLILGGTVEGRVAVRGKVVLEASSSFSGELACGRLHVNEGAEFNGSSGMGDQAVERLRASLDGRAPGFQPVGGKGAEPADGKTREPGAEQHQPEGFSFSLEESPRESGSA